MHLLSADAFFSGAISIFDDVESWSGRECRKAVALHIVDTCYLLVDMPGQ